MQHERMSRAERRESHNRLVANYWAMRFNLNIASPKSSPYLPAMCRRLVCGGGGGRPSLPGRLPPPGWPTIMPGGIIGPSYPPLPPPLPWCPEIPFVLKPPPPPVRIHLIHIADHSPFNNPLNKPTNHQFYKPRECLINKSQDYSLPGLSV